MEKIISTFIDNNDNHYTKKMELTTSILMDTIREFIVSQYKSQFGINPENIDMYVTGFILFNMHRKKHMLKNKTKFLEYVNNDDISIEEKMYFENIVLYIQQPDFLTDEELEKFRACGVLD